MRTPFPDPAVCRDELHLLATRAGVSVEHLCATVEAATRFARDSVAAHKVGPNPPFPTDDDDLDAVIGALWDDDFTNDHFEDDCPWEVKQVPWNESEHPRDEDGRFTSGGSAGHSAHGAQGDAGIGYGEVVAPSVPADKYQPPLRVMSAEEARDLVVERGEQMAEARRQWATKNNLSDKKLEGARQRLIELEAQRSSDLDETQQAALNHKMKVVGEEIERLRQLEVAERTDTAKLRQLLYVVDPTTLNVRFDAHPNFANQVVQITSEHQKAAAITGSEEVRRLVSENLLIGDVYFEQESNPESRSNHAGNSRIKLAGDAGTRMVVHEFGHDLEALNPTVRRKALDFLDKRTRGEKLLKLSEKSPHYKENEVYRKDKFIHYYMGKIYPNMRTTEIFSMGLEYFHSDPLALAKGDPEYFDFIYNTLRGQ